MFWLAWQLLGVVLVVGGICTALFFGYIFFAIFFGMVAEMRNPSRLKVSKVPLPKQE